VTEHERVGTPTEVTWQRVDGRWRATAQTTLGISIDTGDADSPLSVADEERITDLLSKACEAFDEGHLRLCRILQEEIEKSRDPATGGTK
jgi:hypothetical protein